MDVANIWQDSLNTVNGWFSAEQSGDILTLASVSLLALVSVVVGAFVARHSIRKLTTESLERQQQQVLANQRAAVDGFLHALHVESKVVFETFQTKVGKAFETLEENEALLKCYPQASDYFCVYNNNTKMLGEITNDALRLQIVKANALFKAFLDTLRYHDQLVSQFNALDLIAHQSQKPIDEGTAKRQLNTVKEHTKTLKLEHSVMSAQMYQMISMLRSHRHNKLDS
jgi:hypothetical protein